MKPEIIKHLNYILMDFCDLLERDQSDIGLMSKLGDSPWIDDERMIYNFLRGIFDSWEKHDIFEGEQVFDGPMRDDMTSLHTAVLSGSVDLVKLALKFEEKIDQCDTLSGQAPLLIAMIMDLIDVTRVLLEAGADPNLYQCYPSGSLFGEYLKKHKSAIGNDMMKLLLDHGADVDSIDDYGRSLIFYLQEYEVIKSLLEAGARVDIQDKCGESILDYREDLYRRESASRRQPRSEYRKIMNLLIEHGARF